MAAYGNILSTLNSTYQKGNAKLKNGALWLGNVSVTNFIYCITVNPLLSPLSQISPLPLISPPFQGKKVYKPPPLPSLNIFH